MIRQIINTINNPSNVRLLSTIRTLPATYGSIYRGLLETQKQEDEHLCTEHTNNLIKKIQQIITESVKGEYVPDFDNSLFDCNSTYTFYNNKVYLGGLYLESREFNKLGELNHYNSTLTYALYQLAQYDIDIVHPMLTDEQYIDSFFDEEKDYDEPIKSSIDSNTYVPDYVHHQLDKIDYGTYVAFGISPDNIDRIMDMKV